MPLGLVQGVINAFGAHKANKRLDKLLSQDPTYTQSPYAQNQLALAQLLFGGRMAGAGAQEQNIYNNQASTLNNISRNTGDAARELALAGAVQGQTNDAFANLGSMEAQNRYGMLNNLNQAYGTMINEGDKSYQDRVRRSSDLAQIRGMQQQNRFNATNGIFQGLNNDANDIFQVLGLAGAFDNVLGKKGK